MLLLIACCVLTVEDDDFEPGAAPSGERLAGGEQRSLHTAAAMYMLSADSRLPTRAPNHRHLQPAT